MKHRIALVLAGAMTAQLFAVGAGGDEPAVKKELRVVSLEVKAVTLGDALQSIRQLTGMTIEADPALIAAGRVSARLKNVPALEAAKIILDAHNLTVEASPEKAGVYVVVRVTSDDGRMSAANRLARKVKRFSDRGVPAAEQKQIDAAIKALGAAKSGARRAARIELEAFGEKAIAALIEVLDADDPEVSVSVHELLKKLERKLCPDPPVRPTPVSRRHIHRH